MDDLERLGALIATVDRLVRAGDAERALAEDPRAFLARSGLDGADVDALAALGARRLLVYRRHVQGTLRRTMRLQIPRASALLGASLDAWIERWLAEDGPRSRYLRDAPFELVAWAVPRWAEDASLPPWLGDLARHELAHFDVAAAPDDGDEAGEGLELTSRARFHASVRLFRYAWAVHRLSEDPSALEARFYDGAASGPKPRAPAEPVHEPTAILAYRDADHEVRWLELTPLAAAILDRLIAGATLRDAVVGGATDLGRAIDDAVTSSTAALLTDLTERGALLGARAP